MIVRHSVADEFVIVIVLICTGSPFHAEQLGSVLLEAKALVVRDLKCSLSYEFIPSIESMPIPDTLQEVTTLIFDMMCNYLIPLSLFFLQFTDVSSSATVAYWAFGVFI